MKLGLRLATLTLGIGITGASVAACAPEVTSGSTPQAVDYLSPKGREYAITATSSITLQGDDTGLDYEAREAKVRDLVNAKATAIGTKLGARLNASWTEDDRWNKEGIAIMIRQPSIQGSDVAQTDEETYGFTFRAELGAPNDFLDKFPFDDLGDAGKGLRVTLDGTDGDAGETIDLAVAAEAQSSDAYPLYAEMFDDGFDIAIHEGGDHDTPRADLDNVQAIWSDLTDNMGFTAPAGVTKFEDLKIDSGPFTRQMDVGGKAVDVRVHLYHADMAPEDKEHKALIEAYKASAKTADVIVYAGHAGTDPSYSGVVVSYDPRTAIPANDFKSLDLPEKYQIFVFDGCETYSGYADKMYENPKKNARNADVVTTVDFTPYDRVASADRALLHGLLDQVSGTWMPRPWEYILERVNADKGGHLPIYGVHGIDDNPKTSPLADLSTVGQTCAEKSDCPGVDSLCVSLSDNTKHCGAACTDTSGCPDGSTCRDVIADPTIGEVKQCLPVPVEVPPSIAD